MGIKYALENNADYVCLLNNDTIVEPNLIEGLLKRIAGLAKIPGYDFIVIYREAAPIGPPIFEWIYTKVDKKSG